VLIPAGEFEMGDHHGMGEDDELPVHAVYLDAFLMDIFETTNAQYAQFLNHAMAEGEIETDGETIYKAGTDLEYYAIWTDYSRILWNGQAFYITPGREDHPVVLVTFYGVAAYANWRSEQEGRQPAYDTDTWECRFGLNGYRLPTEAEWEYAARGGENAPYYVYPWGDTIDGSMSNYRDSGDPFETQSRPRTTPVGYFNGGQSPPGPDMANGYGLYDMAGNATEWCHDVYRPDYYADSPYDNPRGPSLGWGYVVRGGHWDADVVDVRSSRRSNIDRGGSSYILGCRLVLDAE
jgi:formylglycine-generating enzyme required for sulfatase activity